MAEGERRPLPHCAIQICLLGGFRILKGQQRMPVRAGGKVEQLLGALAFHAVTGVERDALLNLIWPEADRDLAGQSLNSLVHSIARSWSVALSGQPPLVRDAHHYILNFEAGIAIDVQRFDTAVDAGDRFRRAGFLSDALQAYGEAVALYAGDLIMGSGTEHLIERERLRARLLSAQASLGELHFSAGDYERTLATALRLLAVDPCREDAHRLLMRCYVRLGQRAQALRQYDTCKEALALDFDALPEASTDELFRQIRTDPSHV